jgi:acetolactate synthase-1/2/3 large subunit
MPTTAKTRRMNGGHAVVDCLRNEGVRHVFNVPGESFTSILDGLRDAKEIQLITNRHEGGACLMAEAYTKATRTPGVCVVTRGPGATHASIGIHCARHDSTPLVLLVGQVERATRGREAGQEIDYTHFFGSLAKWVIEVSDPRRLPAVLSRAFHLARSGRPGPVVVSLPRDMLDETADMPLVEPYPVLRANPEPALIQEMVQRLGAAKNPIIVAGSGTEYAGARQELIAFSEKFQVPVVTTYRRLAAFPNDHAHYLGNLSSARNHTRDAVAGADLVLAIGTRLNQQTTAGWTLPHPDQTLIQIDPAEEVIGQNHRPTIGMVSDIKLALAAALEYPAPPPNPGRQGWIDEYRKVQQAWATPPERPTGQVSMEKVMMDMKTTLPKDTVHTVDAGNFALWVHKYQEFGVPDTFFGPTVGCMGYGVPSAIGAKLAHPNRVAIAHCGDGGFLMTGQEMATAAQYGINIIAVVYNNGALATIRMHQEAQYPNRPSGTDFVNPDFAALGTAYRALGIQVTRDHDFLPALQEALKANRPALIEVMTELEFISPTATLSQVTVGQPGR